MDVAAAISSGASDARPCGVSELAGRPTRRLSSRLPNRRFDGSLIGGDLLIEGIARMLSASPLSLFALDARCAPERVREGYPRFGAFEAVRAAVAGAPPRFASELSRRLAL